MAKFTDASVRNLKPTAERYEKHEDGGLRIVVYPTGERSWAWRYKFEGRSRKHTLGRYADTADGEKGLSLADARVAYEQARKLLKRGVDPGAKDVEQREAARLAETVTELRNLYLTKWARPNKRSAHEDERILDKDVLPAWGLRKARDIGRRDVIGLLDKIVERGSPVAANRTLAVVRRMFNWAISRDIVQVNPCAQVKAPAKEKTRERVLSVDELRSFWLGLDDQHIEMSRPIRLALKFQLITAQRKGEVIGAEWAEFDLSHAVWTIPPDKVKNGKAHRVPLSSLAISLLNEVKEAGKRTTREGKTIESRYLFPSPRADRSISGPAVDHAMRDNRHYLGTDDATPHDLRRTAASYMTSYGVSRLTVSKVLNHAERGVTAIYDRHSYDSEKRTALELWALKLHQLVSLPLAE